MTDDLLKASAAAIRSSAYAAYSMSLSGAFPSAVSLYNWMKKMSPGDLVFETSTAWYPDRDINAVGILEKIVREPISAVDPDFEWNEEEEGEPEPTWECFYIKTLDGRPYRWHNASFLRVPTMDANRF